MSTASGVVDAIAILAAVLLLNQFVLAFDIENTATPIYVLVSVIVLLAVVRFSSFVFASSLKRSMWFRKLVFADEFIEGIWINGPENPESSTYGLLEISFDDDGVKILGRQFGPSGELIATWQSLFGRFQKRELEYVYRTHYVASKDLEEQIGFSTIKFLTPPWQQMPLYYDGYYTDLSRSLQRHYFSGQKLQARDVSSKLNTASGRKELISNLNLGDRESGAVEQR